MFFQSKTADPHTVRLAKYCACTRQCAGSFLPTIAVGGTVGVDGAAVNLENADHFIIRPDLQNLNQTIYYLREHDDIAQAVAARALARSPTRDKIFGGVANCNDGSCGSKTFWHNSRDRKNLVQPVRFSVRANWTA